MEAMNPVMRVGTGSVPSALLGIVVGMADRVEPVPTVHGRGSWVESMVQRAVHGARERSTSNAQRSTSNNLELDVERSAEVHG